MNELKVFRKLLAVVILLFSILPTLQAKEYYWVNGSGNWEDPSHWALKSGGISNGETPSKRDDVFFDQNSSSESFVLSSKEQVELNSWSFNSNYQMSVDIISLTIYGSFKASATMLDGPNNGWIFSGKKSINNIDPNGFTFVSNVQFIGKKGHQLQSPLLVEEAEVIRFETPFLTNNLPLFLYAKEISVGLETIEWGNSSVFIEKRNDYKIEEWNILRSQVLIKGKKKDPKAINCIASINSDYMGTSISCNGANDGVVCVQTTGGSGGYSYIWTGGSAPPSDSSCWTGLGSGTYRVFVTDTVTGEPCTDKVVLIEPDEVGTFNFVFTAPSCNTNCDGTATHVPVGGNDNFPYDFDWSSSETTQNATKLCVGNNQLSITDVNGCVFDTIVTIGLPSKISFNASAVQVSCFGACDGKSIASPSGGSGSSYSLIWTDPITNQVLGTEDSLLNLCGPTGVTLGKYALRVTDDLGCSLDTVINIVEPAGITLNFSQIQDNSCFGSCDGQLTIDAQNGSGIYSYEWFVCGDNTVIGTAAQETGLCAGSYYVKVTDSKGCTKVSGCRTIGEPTEIIVNLVGKTDATCGGICNGAATINVSGGSPNYTVNWFFANTNLPQGGTGFNNNTLCADVFYALVTDNNGCTQQSENVIINENVDIQSTVSVTDATCFEACDGNASVTSSGGTLPHTYEWKTQLGAVVSSSNTANNLCAGTYLLSVEDVNGCRAATQQVTIIEFPEITTNAIVQQVSCFNACDAAITVSAQGGTGIGFSYDWTPDLLGNENIPNPTGLCAGQLQLTIRDDIGCVKDTTFVLTQPNPFNLVTNQTDINCGGECTGEAIVSDLSGSNLSYNWSPVPPNGQGTNQVNGLCIGNWSVDITNVDLGCDTTIVFSIAEPDELVINTRIVTDNICFGECLGIAVVDVIGGNPNYTIQWNDPGNQNSLIASNLCAGSFDVTVTDASNCSQTASVTISEPSAFIASATKTDINCHGQCSGQATVTVAGGGTPPYSYLWNDLLNQTTPTAFNLCAGIYEVTVTDLNACDTILEIEIEEPDELLVAVNKQDISCFNSCNGSIEVTPSGGTGNYSITWINSLTGQGIGVNGILADNLCPGTYHANVVDENNCVFNTPPTIIIEPSEISIIDSTIVKSDCNSCNGSISVIADGGSGVFNSYTWTPGPTTGQGTPNALGLCSGGYSLLVEDNAGCSEQFLFGVSDKTTEQVAIVTSDVTCFGANDGAANVMLVCTDGPCVVRWMDDQGNVVIQNQNSVNGLSPGDYLIEIRNNSNCLTTLTFTISEPNKIIPNEIVIDPTCSGACNGTVSIAAIGGSGNYNYLWSPAPPSGQGTATASGLCAGAWSITITDDNNCDTTVSVNLLDVPVLDVSNITSSNISCFGDNNGTAVVFPTGGSGNYSYEWLNCATNQSIGQTTQQALNLSPGTYFARVTDGGACVLSTTCITVNEPDDIQGNLTATGTCFGECNGTGTVVPLGGNLNYHIQWLDENNSPVFGAVNNTVTGLCEGVYNVRITDLNNCTKVIGPIVVPEADQYQVQVASSKIPCSNACDGEATVSVITGGIPPYSYLWNDPNGQTTATASGLCAGAYSVSITDVLGCDTTVSILLISSPEILPNAALNQIGCNGSCDGAIQVSPTGGVGAITANWPDLGTTNTTLSNLCPGNYRLVLTDEENCELDSTFSIIEPTLLNVVTAGNDEQCNLCNGTASVSVSGGIAPYNFVWSPTPATGQGTQNISDLCTGVYTVQITDAKGCSTTSSVAISSQGGEIITTTVTPPLSCAQECNGVAVVDPFICQSPPCTSQWFEVGTNTKIADGSSVSNLCGGDYYVELINSTGCKTIEIITIKELPPIQANESITAVTCSGSNNGEIQLSPSGGTGNFTTFIWTPAPPFGSGTDHVWGLSPGVWKVELIDDIGCSDTLSFTIPELNPLTTIETVTSNNCFGNCNGVIDITISGGSGNYLVEWFDENSALLPVTGNRIENLCTGSYSYRVSDVDQQNVCQITSGSIAISEPTELLIPVTVTQPFCNGVCDGTASVSITGGLAPYVINWYDAATNTFIAQSTNTATSLCAGFYYATVTDANNCSKQSSTVQIVNPTEIQSQTATTNVSCFGNCDGTITLTVTGGAGNYSFSWMDDGMNLISGANSSSIKNLCAGTYYFVVEDDNGCRTIAEQVNITEPLELTGNVFSNNANCGIDDGSATVIVTGGSKPFLFTWFDQLGTNLSVTDSFITAIGAGSYVVRVTDANTCSVDFGINVSNFNAPVISIDQVQDVSCFGGCDGAIDISVLGGQAPYTYAWNPGGIVQEDLSNLCPGNYDLRVKDRQGCLAFETVEIKDKSDFIISTSLVEPTCGKCDGSISATIVGVNLKLLWNTGEKTTTIADLCAGSYQLIVEDTVTGCVKKVQIPLSNQSAPKIDRLSVDSVSCSGLCDGAIQVTMSGGITPYQFNWLDDPINSDTRSNLCAGSYALEVLDGNNCLAVTNVSIPEPKLLQENPIIVPATCSVCDGTINPQITGGTGALTYSWDSGQTTQTLNNVCEGIYNLTVEDAQNCQQNYTYTVSGDKAATVQINVDEVTCFNDCNGKLDAIVSNGSPNYSYSWLSENGTPLGISDTFMYNLCAGKYLLEVQDASGCFAYSNAEISQPTELRISTPIVGDISCGGICDGTVNVVVTGGDPSYQVQWNNNPLLDSTALSNLCVGSYILDIIDQNNCAVQKTIQVIEPLPIHVVIDSVSPAICLNTNEGSIGITSSGGSGNHSFNWTSIPSGYSSTDEDVSGLFPMSYVVHVKDENNCFRIDTIAIDTSEVVIANAGADVNLCFEPSQVVLTGIATGTGITDRWTSTVGNTVSAGNILSFPVDNPIDTQFVYVVSNGICSDTDTASIQVRALPEADAGFNKTIIEGMMTDLGGITTGTGTITYNWSPGDDLSDSTSYNPVISPDSTTTYILSILDEFGCTDVDTVTITVLPEITFPNGITPNGDGTNDEWEIEYLGEFPASVVEVYNRWGELLFRSVGYQKRWDGMYNGSPLPVGTYYYVINLNDPLFPSPYTGPITILR